MKRKVNCPYCGFKNSVQIDLDEYWEPQLVVCGGEDGGCDRRFVAEADITVTFETMKIEGEELPRFTASQEAWP